MTAAALWKLIGIRGAIALGFAGLALAFWIGWSNAADERDDYRNKLAQSEAQHAVTIASLDVLAAEMQKMVEAGEMRESRLKAALSEARSAGNVLRRQAEAILAEGGSPDACVTPRGILRSGI